MTNRERNILILVLAILSACGLVTRIHPAPAVPGAPARVQERAVEQAPPLATYTLVPTFTPTARPALSSPLEPDATHTPLPTPTPTATPTPVATPPPTAPPTSPSTAPWTATPTSAPWPTATPTPDEAPTETPTPVPTETPRPTSTPTPAPLVLDWVLVEKHCISDAQWFLEFWLTAGGGTGEYTFYRDIESLHGPAPVHGFGYQMYAGTASAVVGTFAVESGAQRVESAFWVERMDCAHLAPPPTPEQAGSAPGAHLP